MEPKKAFYSLIQYCPDFSRHEMVNVGVVLIVPADRCVTVRTSGNNNRVRKFFGQGSFDNASLNLAKSSIEKRLLTEQQRFAVLEEFEKFANSRGNNLVITRPRPIKVVEPGEEIERLFRELVMQREERRKQPIFPVLDRDLRLDDAGKRQRHKVGTMPGESERIEKTYWR